MYEMNYCQMIGQESHEEAAEELPSKAKFFFSAAVETWDAEFYVKVEDNINLDLGIFFHVLCVCGYTVLILVLPLCF